MHNQEPPEQTFKHFIQEHKLNIYETIIATYPNLPDGECLPGGSITIRDDSDGQGQYLAKWDYSEPIPEGLKFGK